MNDQDSSNEAKTPLATDRVAKDIQLDADESPVWATMTQFCGYCGGKVRHACSAFLKTQDGASPQERNSTTVTDNSSVQHFQGEPETEASRNDPEERLCVACGKPSWAHSCNRPPLGSPPSSTLAEIKERRSKITPLPWLYFMTDEGLSVCSSGGPCEDHFVPSPHCHKCIVFDGVIELKDAVFIANAPSDIDTLLGIIDSLQPMSHTESYKQEDDK